MRSLLTHVKDQNGTWVARAEALGEAIRKHPELAWVSYAEQKPGARIAVTKVIERLRHDEFPEIDRQKRGPHRNSPVFYRLKK